MAIDDLSAAQTAIVEVLRDGRATTGYLADETAYSSAHLNTQLRILRATDTIHTVHEPTALHELSDSSLGPATPITVALDDTLSAAETAIVEVLRNGRATTGSLIDAIDYSRSHINTHLRLLLAKEIIVKVHPPTALYELTDTARKTTPDDDTANEPTGTADAEAADT